MSPSPAVLWHVEPQSSVPIYRQLARQVREAIARGELKAGDQLPSLRDTARELVINHLTVKQAYNLLERDHIIETMRGRGTFIRPTAIDALRGEVHRDLAQRMKALADSAKRSGLHQKQFQQLAQRMWDNHKEKP